MNAAIRTGLSEPRRAATDVDLPSFRFGLLPGIDPMRLNAALDDAVSDDRADVPRRAE